jgi:hypothetical protein
VACLIICHLDRRAQIIARDDNSGSCRHASGGIIFERNSVRRLVYPPGGPIVKKQQHATKRNRADEMTSRPRSHPIELDHLWFSVGA